MLPAGRNHVDQLLLKYGLPHRFRTLQSTVGTQCCSQSLTSSSHRHSEIMSSSFLSCSPKKYFNPFLHGEPLARKGGGPLSAGSDRSLGRRSCDHKARSCDSANSVEARQSSPFVWAKRGFKTLRLWSATSPERSDPFQLHRSTLA